MMRCVYNDYSRASFDKRHSGQLVIKWHGLHLYPPLTSNLLDRNSGKILAIALRQ